jgi:hypothetical protein
MRRRRQFVSATLAVAVVMTGCSGASGGVPAARTATIRTQGEFDAFCRANPGACHEPPGDVDDLRSAQAIRDWPKRACPRRVLDPGPRAPEGVVREMRAAVPRLIHITNGDPVKLTAENTRVLDVRPLRDEFVDLPGVRTLRGFAAYFGRGFAERLCGRRTASRSWAALLQFPEAQAVPLSYSILFFARTPQGWTAWYPRPQ